MFRRLVALGLLLALVPIAAALPGQGDLRVDGPLRLPGTTHLSPESLSLTASPADGGATVVEGASARLSVEIIRWSAETVGTGPLHSIYTANSGFTSERQEFRDATFRVADAPDGAFLVLDAQDLTAANVALRDARLAGVASAILYPGLQSGGASTSGTGGEAVDVAETVELSSYDLAATMTGAFALRVDGAVVEIVSGGKTTQLASGHEETSGNAATSKTTNTLLILQWVGTSSVTTDGVRAAAYTLAPAQAAGLEADAARGVLVVDGDRHDLDGDALGLAGAITVRAAPAQGISAPSGGSVQYAPGLQVGVSGDFDRVSVASSTLSAVLVPAVGGLAALAAAVAIAWYWPLLKYGLTAGYTRLKEPELLDNRVRNGIFGIIKEHPGISARSIHRESGQSWGTVVYHLRQLERHRLVKSARVGRFRTYYEGTGRFNGLEDGFAAVQNEKTRHVARLVAQQPGITQEQLTREAGLPQSTVSYYIRKLKQARLVDERRNGKYAAYFPGENLAEVLGALANAEAQPATVIAVPSAS